MKKTTSVLSIILALLMVLNVSAFAAGGEGGGDKSLTLVSAKVGEEDLAGARIPAGSEIALTFSNNVTESDLLGKNTTKIKIKSAADGTAVDASIKEGAERQVIIVTLGSEVAKGDYILTIGKDLEAKNGNTLGEKVEIAFSVKGEGNGSGGGNNPLSVVSVTVNGKPIYEDPIGPEGEITITFDRGMTDNQEANFEQICFVDLSNTKIEGVTMSFTDFKKDSDGNSYTVLTYSGLKNGEHSLRLGKDLKANNGKTLGIDSLYACTVEGGEDEPAEKTFIEQVKDFFNMIVDYIRNAINQLMALLGIAQ